MEEGSMGLMSPSSSSLQKALMSMSIIMVLLCVLGIIREKIQFKKNKNKSKFLHITVFRSSRSQVFYKTTFLKKFAEFFRK